MTNEKLCYNCGGKYYAKGLCKNCYNKLRYSGTLEALKRGRPYCENTVRIIDLRNKGIRQIDIAKQLGISRQLVSQVIKRHCKPTNADRIRSMTDEELAEWGASWEIKAYARVANDCEVCLNCDKKQITEDWLTWLQQEVKDG